MNDKTKLEESVIIIDTSYLNRVVTDLSNHFTKELNKNLPKANLSTILECISLDSGMQDNVKPIQVILIYDKHEDIMSSIYPSDLAGKLSSCEFNSTIGKFLINSYESSDISSKEDFYIESLKLLIDSKDVKKILSVASDDINNDVKEVLKEAPSSMKTYIFGMVPIEGLDCVNWDMIGFAVLKSLGISSEDIN